MKSLTHCLSSLNIDGVEARYIQNLVNKRFEEGLSDQEIGEIVINDLIDELNNERESVISQLNKTITGTEIKDVTRVIPQNAEVVFNNLLAGMDEQRRSLASKLVSSGKVVLMSNSEAMAEAERAGYSTAEVNAESVPIGIEISGKTILIPENIPDGELWGALRHAIGTHIGRMVKSNAEFQLIKKTVMRRQNEDSATGKAIRRAMKQVPDNTDPENYSEEVIAYMVSSSEDIGLVRRIIAMIKNFITRFGVSYRIFNEQDFKALADIAIRREANGTEQTMFDSDGIKFQMVGPVGAIGVHRSQLQTKVAQKSLDRAKEMKKNGSDRKLIWAETGWWELVPGEWQYEIDDSAGEFSSKVWGGMKPNSKVKLPGIYKNKELFILYPQLKEVNVIAAKLDINHYGGYDLNGNIKINISSFGDVAKSTLLHEIQHAIQDYENFSKGGSVGNQVSKNQREIWQLDNEITSINQALKFVVDNGLKSPNGQLLEGPSKLYHKFLARRNSIIERFQDLTGNLISISQNEYKRLTGEVQSRLVQTRRRMTPDERKKYAPWETLQGMLIGEALMGFDQNPEDILISRKDATVAGWADSYSPTLGVGSVQPAVTFLDRMKNTVDLEEAVTSLASYFWNKDAAIERLQKHLGNQPIERDYATMRSLVGKIVSNDIKKFDKEILQPFLQFLSDKKIQVQDLEKMAHAQHAPERNLQMRRVNARRYIDALLQFMTDAEKRPWQEGLGDIQDEFVMNDQTRNQRRDNNVELLEEIADTVRTQRAQVDQLARDLAARVFTAEEINKGTPDNLRKRLDNMYARLEKRESLVALWDSRKDHLSGMTDSEAKAIERSYSGNLALYEATKMLRDISRKALDINHEAGEISDEEYAAIVGTYQYHVPLYREDVDDGKTPTGRTGVGPLGKPVQTATGSTKGVVDILSHVVDRYQSAITRRRKLEAGRALYEMVKGNPDEEVWSIVELEKKPDYDDEGNIRLYPSLQPNPKYQTPVKVDGKRYFIEVNKNNKVAVGFMEAINRQVTPLGPLTRMSGAVNRVLARLSTTWTPEFALPNFVRDLQTAMVNMSSTEAAGMQSKVFGNIGKAVAGIYRSERGKPSGLWGTVYQDAAENGVIMGWMSSYDDIKQLSKKIEIDLEMKNGGHKVRENIMRLGNLVESINLSIENGVRVATYHALTESGIDKRNAARVASNLTVDFTKHGTAGPAINSLWMFANAGIQGNIRIFQALSSSPTVRKTVVGIAGLGALIGMLGAVAGGEDDDGETYYDKLKKTNPTIFERNMVIMIPGGEGDYIKIPMAYGYNIFFKFGEEVSSVLRGQKPLESGLRWVKSVVNNLNPLAAGTILQTMAPTLADPMVQVMENAAWHGGPLMPPLNPYVNLPDSERYFRDVNPISKTVTEWLNKHTGGSRFKEGAISVSPETVEMIMETMAGGAGKMVKDTLNLPFAIADGDLSVRNVPIARRFVGVTPSGINKQIYYENREEMQTFVKELKNATREERPSLIREPFYKMVGAFERTETKLKDLNKRRKEIVSKAGDTERIDDLIRDTQVEFNKRYNATIGRD